MVIPRPIILMRCYNKERWNVIKLSCPFSVFQTSTSGSRSPKVRYFNNSCLLPPNQLRFTAIVPTSRRTFSFKAIPNRLVNFVSPVELLDGVLLTSCILHSGPQSSILTSIVHLPFKPQPLHISSHQTRPNAEILNLAKIECALGSWTPL